MKHVPVFLAVCMAVAAVPSMAQSNDNAKIEQGGGGSHAVVEQIFSGGGNHAMVRQGEAWYGGGGNGAQVLQQGVQVSYVDIYQTGYNNHYTVSQYDGGNLQANINTSGYYGDGGEGNSVMVQQSGYDARAFVEQGGGMYSRAEIVQEGWGGQNVAEIMQRGDANQAGIYQSGTNQAMIQQMGSNLSATIMQQSNGYGHGNTAMIRQGY